LDNRKADFAQARARYQAALTTVEEVEAAARPEELRIAEAEITLARSRVDQARHELQKTQLRAPMDGIVLQRWGEPGQLVGPDAQQPIFILADATEKRVRAFVEELSAMDVAAGSRVYVEADGLPGSRVPGRVIRCAPSMVPKVNFNNKPSERVDVRVREVVIRLDDGPLADTLVVGLPVDVFVESSETPVAESPTLLTKLPPTEAHTH
jgi:multidrug resistance efflux pump